MGLKGSSRRWLQEHFNDPYVKQAQQLGYRSRSVFKLLEMNEKDKLFEPGMVVLDLGAAPGGWSQVAIKLVQPHGRIIAMDILPMEPIPGVEFIQGDIEEDEVLEELERALDGEHVHLVMSDIAANMSGITGVDIPRSIGIAELVLDFALKVLAPNGSFLIKVFQGEGFDGYFAELKRHFKRVAIRKPKASRSRSREVYLLAQNLKSP